VKMILYGLFFGMDNLPCYHHAIKDREYQAYNTLVYLRIYVLSHPKCGASWEGYVIEETIKATKPDETYYWATHGGAEIDLVLTKKGRMLGVECKRIDAPRITPSMRIAREELNLEQIAVVYPGRKRYALGNGVTAVPLNALTEGIKGLFPGKK
ncbi:MAG: DUF4143 domain-containing protein, partial [Thermodesulfovibrionales bacterium]